VWLVKRFFAVSPQALKDWSFCPQEWVSQDSVFRRNGCPRIFSKGFRSFFLAISWQLGDAKAIGLVFDGFKPWRSFQVATLVEVLRSSFANRARNRTGQCMDDHNLLSATGYGEIGEPREVSRRAGVFGQSADVEGGLKVCFFRRHLSFGPQKAGVPKFRQPCTTNPRRDR